MPFSFTLGARDPRSRARRGTLRTSRGTVETPVFMPVGTHATVTGVTPDELGQAKQSILALIDRSRRTNEYWLTAIGAAQEFPQRLDWCRMEDGDISAITREEATALAARCLVTSREVSYLVLPESF